MIASDCDSDSSWLCFSWPISDYYSGVGDFAAFGNVALVDELAGISAFDVFVSLEKASNFIAHGRDPVLAVTALGEFDVFCV